LNWDGSRDQKTKRRQSARKQSLVSPRASEEEEKGRARGETRRAHHVPDLFLIDRAAAAAACRVLIQVTNEPVRAREGGWLDHRIFASGGPVAVEILGVRSGTNVVSQLINDHKVPTCALLVHIVFSFAAWCLFA
jgi:hypothetical protein